MIISTVGKEAIKNHNSASLKRHFDESIIEGGRTEFGIATFPPGSRIPTEGTGSHDQDEYGMLIKGSMIIMSGGKEYRITAGQATFIPRGEEHWAYNDGQEECEIVWALVNR